MTRWYQEKKKEHYYKEAKRTGYRARSAFKLKQIDKRFKIFSKNSLVVDLGAAPGGWSQVAQELIGEQGRIVGVDILPIKPIKGIEFIQGDITDNLIIVEIKNRLNNCKANIILSDISPDISGNYSVDHARSIWLCEKVLDISIQLLGPGGFLICKVFEGPDLSKFIENVKKYFNSVKKFSPTASRKRSSEIYIIAKPLKNISP